jgi:hypothetical protein
MKHEFATFQLIYSSKAEHPFTASELLSLLERARAFNASHDISGLLLYADGRFIQVLEGAPEVIQSLQLRIENDPRHDHVRVLMQRRIAHRDFAEWHMAFRQVDAAGLAGHPHLLRFFDTEFSTDHFLPWASPASYLLRAFRELA